MKNKPRTIIGDLRFWVPALISLPVIFISLFLAFLSAGAGHGDYLAAKVLFPLPMLSTNAFGSITALSGILALAQFPLYGIICGIGNVKGKLVFSIALLSVFHILTVFICLIFIGAAFS